MNLCSKALATQIQKNLVRQKRNKSKIKPMLPYEEVKIKSEALIESHVKIIKGVNFVATDIDKIKTAVRNEAILHSISSQQGVVDAYSQSANEVINSQTDYKSILKLRDESQQIIDHLKSL